VIGSTRIGARGARRGARHRGTGSGAAWRIATGCAGVLAALAVLATQAPASLVDVALERATQGRVRLAEASGETDPALRLRKLAEVERWLFNEEMPMLPICNYVTVYMYDPVETAGITDHPRLEQDLSVLGPRRDAATGSAP
jgi:hypothetical protein